MQAIILKLPAGMFRQRAFPPHTGFKLFDIDRDSVGGFAIHAQNN